ncbi:MAG: hypothetical protein IJ049_03100 [Oscillospiraceae bacterium]|nr:hypothetical protein [Oscillospiraceae bacterium]
MRAVQINIHVDREDDLYNSFDSGRQTLSNDLIEYISDCYTEKHLDERAVLSFSGASIDTECLKNALQRYVRHEIEQNDRERKRNFAKMIRLLAIGLVFVAAAILLSTRLDSILIELISIVGSFAVWEAANIRIVENPSVRLRECFLKRLQETEIVVE